MPSYIQGNLALDPKRKSTPAPRVKIKETTKVVYRNKTLPDARENAIFIYGCSLCHCCRALLFGVMRPFIR